MAMQLEFEEIRFEWKLVCDRATSGGGGGGGLKLILSMTFNCFEIN